MACCLKSFDTEGMQEREGKRDVDSKRMEYAYSLMAKAAGLDMPDTRLVEVDAKHGKRGLFGVKRFDRRHGCKIHMHPLHGKRGISNHRTGGRLFP